MASFRGTREGRDSPEGKRNSGVILVVLLSLMDKGSGTDRVMITRPRKARRKTTRRKKAEKRL